MDEVKWAKLMEVIEREHAELVKSYLNAHDIEVELIQESYASFAYRFTVGRVEILVPNFQIKEARSLYDASGWDFEIQEDDDYFDEDDKE